MLSRRFIARNYGLSQGPQVTADGAMRVGQQGDGVEQQIPIARPVNSPSPHRAPLYLYGPPTQSMLAQHNRSAMSGGGVNLALRTLTNERSGG